MGDNIPKNRRELDAFHDEKSSERYRCCFIQEQLTEISSLHAALLQCNSNKTVCVVVFEKYKKSS